MSEEMPSQFALDKQQIDNNYDPTHSDFYAVHLANVNATRQVIASKNIYNNNGLVLVEKGASITATAIRVIANLKLLHPIEDSVTIKDEIDNAQLQINFITVMREDGLLCSIYERDNLSLMLHDQCLSYQRYPLLRQKITVLSERMPEIYSRSLHCAWLAMLIARQMRLSERDINTVFIAALSHDIGMLHVNPEVVAKGSELTTEEWQQIQAHVLIGQKILQGIDGLPSQVSLAVSEHHERCDGTGYPLGKVESELSLPGQIVALADSVTAIYHNRFQAQRRNWRDVIHVVKMNNQAYFYRNDEVLETILRRSELPLSDTVSGNGIPAFIDSFLVKIKQLKERFALFEKMLIATGFTHGDRKLHALQNVFFHIATSVNGSGIFLESYTIELEQLKLQRCPQAYPTVEDDYLMLEEVTFHLLRLHRMLQVYLTSGHCKNPTIQHSLELGLIAFAEFDD